MFLLVFERAKNALAKSGGRVGKFQQHERHEFGGEQFVVAKKMEQFAAFGFFFELVQTGKFALGAGVRFEA